jgi:hypothetical protein
MNRFTAFLEDSILIHVCQPIFYSGEENNKKDSAFGYKGNLGDQNLT